MYLEYHYVIAVILLSALIAGLLVRWRWAKQLDSALFALNTEVKAREAEHETSEKKSNRLTQP